MTDKHLKQVHTVLNNKTSHWVGNGFPVSTLFAYPNLGAVLSPFLLLDYAGPHDFVPSDEARGVGPHPHRGFETVTLVYSGEVDHRDSAGGGGHIGPGDIQWMTAGSGVVHEEFHSPAFLQQGGLLEMVQIWVNLPQKDKWNTPRYQSIEAGQIPAVSLPSEAGQLRVIAGQYEQVVGPAQTFSPINMWDLQLTEGCHFECTLPDDYTAILVVLSGSVRVTDTLTPIDSSGVVIFEQSGTELMLDSLTEVKALILSGQPLNEPIVGSGPFVMNTPEEIYQARQDYQTGKMGRLS